MQNTSGSNRRASSLQALTRLRNECIAKLTYLRSCDKLSALDKHKETLKHVIERASSEILCQKVNCYSKLNRISRLCNISFLEDRACHRFILITEHLFSCTMDVSFSLSGGIAFHCDEEAIRGLCARLDALEEFVRFEQSHAALKNEHACRIGLTVRNGVGVVSSAPSKAVTSFSYHMSIPLMFALKDVALKESAPKELLIKKHRDFIKSYEEKKDDYEYVVSESLRLSGVFWCIAALDLIGSLDVVSRDDVIAFVFQCRDEGGGFGASEGHDPHILHTLSAVQILIMYNSLHLLNIDETVRYVCSLQQPDGSFAGDEWGEIDTRFSFCAVACLALLNRLEAIDMKAAVNYVLRCQNFDGGFGTRPGSESHSGQVYCCLGVLSIARELNRIDIDKLGRPEKLPDVCYSWWVLASLTIIGRQSWIDKSYLRRFILACQEKEDGGFADRPGDEPDPFHTLFGLAGLSLLGEDCLERVNPVFCMPEKRLPASINIQTFKL